MTSRFNTRTASLLCWAATIAAVVAQEAGRAPAVRPPNVLLVVVESLRRDHVGCYGYARPTTPSLDALAAEGVRFDDTVAASSWTMPSVMTLLTGVPPATHGVTNYSCRLHEGVPTLAVALKQAGYQTAGIVSNPLLHGKFGFGRGFDFYDDFTILYNMGASVAGEEPEAPVSERSTGERVTQLALQRLERMDAARPFFLFLFYFDPHYDYRPPAPYDRQFCDADYSGVQDGSGIPALAGKTVSEADRKRIIGLYDGEIRFTDAQIGRLFEALKARGYSENTLVVVTADHGEEFWDHGGVTHGHTLFDELVRVPLIARFPPAIRPGTVVTQSVCHADILPTVLELAGVPIPGHVMGRSLVPLLTTGKQGAAPPAFMAATLKPVLMGVRTPRQKIVAQGNGVKQFYSLLDDPREATNLWGTARTGEFADLERRLAEWSSQMDQSARKAGSAGTPDLDQRLKQQLRSLGYMQ